MPYSWVYPLATSLALYLSTEPSDFFLILYTRQDPIGHFHGGNGTRSHV